MGNGWNGDKVEKKATPLNDSWGRGRLGGEKGELRGIKLDMESRA